MAGRFCGKILTLGAVLGCATTSLQAAPNNDGTTESEIILLKQKSLLLSDTNVYLSKDAIKIVELKCGSTFVAQAPDWKVSVFNDHSKAIYTCPLNKFKGYNKTTLLLQVGYDYTGVPVCKTKRSKKLFDLTTDIFESPPSFTALAEKNFSPKAANPQPGAVRKAIMEGSDCRLPQVEKQALVLGNYYKIGENKTIPLFYTTEDLEGHTNKILTTTSLTKLKVKPSFFAPPKGYKSVSEVETVRIDTGGKESMAGMLMDIDQDLEKRKKK